MCTTSTRAFIGIKGSVTRNLLLEARYARIQEEYALSEELLKQLLPAPSERSEIAVLTELLLVYDESGQDDKAIPVLQKLVRLLKQNGDPDLILMKTYAKLAECQAQAGNYAEAEESCINALAWSNDCNASSAMIGGVLHNLAYVQESLGKSQAAEIQYLLALKHLSPVNDLPLRGLTAANLAELYVRNNRKSEALKYYRLAIKSLTRVSSADDYVLQTIIRQYESLATQKGLAKKRLAGH